MFRKLIVAVCIVGALSFPLILHRTTVTESHAETNRLAKRESSTNLATREVPTHLPYLFLFEHINRLRIQTQNMKRQGKDGSGMQLRFKNRLNVDDGQFAILEEIAQRCLAETTLLDREAKAITDEFRKQYPPGVVPEGVIIPPPPPQLAVLQEMRTNAVLRARERVKGMLGEQGFLNFDENLKRQLLPDVQVIHPAGE